MGRGHGRRKTRTGSYRTACGLLFAAIVCGLAGLIINTAAGNPSKLSKRALVELGGSVIVLWAIALVLLLFSISRFNRARRTAELERGRATARRLEAEHLVQARRLAGQLLAGEVPGAGPVWDVVRQPSERVMLDGTAGYSRYYGFGPAATGAQAGHRSQTNAPASAAGARWRDQQQSRVVVTDGRLLCQARAKGWQSFEHGSVTAIRPVPDKRGVVLEYRDAAPVCLSGPVIAQVMVIVVWALYGAEGMRQHPALAEVMTGLPASTAPVTSEPTPSPAPLDLLGFVAAHELVLAEHAAALLDVSEADAVGRLEGLVAQNLVSRVRLTSGSPVLYRITQRGAGRVDPALPPLRPMDLTGYRRLVALPGLWLTARSGSFGEIQDVLTARQMRAADTASQTGSLVGVPGARFAPEHGTAAGTGYPDLGLLDPGSGWVSADLMLAVPDPGRLREQLRRGGRDSPAVQQWFLIEDERTGELIETLAAELGVADQIRVRMTGPAGVTAG